MVLWSAGWIGTVCGHLIADHDPEAKTEIGCVPPSPYQTHSNRKAKPWCPDLLNWANNEAARSHYEGLFGENNVWGLKCSANRKQQLWLLLQLSSEPSQGWWYVCKHVPAPCWHEKAFVLYEQNFSSFLFSLSTVGKWTCFQLCLTSDHCTDHEDTVVNHKPTWKSLS